MAAQRGTHTRTRQALMFMSRPALSTLLSPSSLRLDSLDAVTQMSGRRITRRRSSPSLGRSQGQRSRTRTRTRSWRSRKRSRLCHGRRARGRRLGCHREVRDILDYPVQVRHLHLLHQQKLLQGDAIVITVVVVGILLGHVPVAVAPRHRLGWNSLEICPLHCARPRLRPRLRRRRLRPQHHPGRQPPRTRRSALGRTTRLARGCSLGTRRRWNWLAPPPSGRMSRIAAARPTSAAVWLLVLHDWLQ